MTGAEFLLRCLRDQGLGHVFLVPGGHIDPLVALRGGPCLNASTVALPERSPQRGREDIPQKAPDAVHISRPTAVRSLRDTEKEAITEALRVCGGNIKRAAARLGIARNTLYRKMEDYALVSEGDEW